MISSVMTFSPTCWFVVACITPMGTVYMDAEDGNVLKLKIITTRSYKRTNSEGKYESPYGELCVPHLNCNNTEHEHGH